MKNYLQGCRIDIQNPGNCGSFNITTDEVIRIGKKHSITFEIEANPLYSERNLKRLRKSIAEVEAGHSAVHEIP